MPNDLRTKEEMRTEIRRHAVTIEQMQSMIIDLNNRLTAVQAAARHKPQYRPAREEVIARMEETGESWAVCEQEIMLERQGERPPRPDKEAFPIEGHHGE